MIANLNAGTLALILDLLVAGLLVATIVYAWVLNRKLAALRNAKPEMEQLIARFVQATARAENGLAEIRQTAEQTGEELQQAADKGQTIADDLVFLVERAGKLADRLAVPNNRRGSEAGRASEAMEPRPEATDKVTSKLRALR